MNNTALVRSMVIYAICLPLAIVLGYLVSNPLDPTTDITLMVVMFLLILPLLLRWYHAWLIIIWNMGITFIYFPGLLPGWMPVACVGFAVAVGHYILNRERKFLTARSVSWSVIALGLVVVITAKFRGGLGFHAFGDESIGGKRYLWIWVAIIGYFTLISQPILPQKRRLYVTLYLLGTVAMVIPFLAGYLGPVSYVVSVFFPGGSSTVPLQSDPMGVGNLERFGGLANASMAGVFVLIARYGIGGILDFRRIWRPLLFLACIVTCFFGGFRSIIILIALTMGLLFCFEGLLRSRLMPVMVLGLVLIGGLSVTFSDRLPLPVQRCLAIFPLKLDPVARLSAEGSSEWRLEIWRFLLPQIPQYLFLGKGLTFDANDMAMNMTIANQVDSDPGGQANLAGDYHSGPLSVIITFGIWGCIAFLWFLVASIQVLWANYKYGEPEIKKLNSFLIAYFIAKTALFLFIFGGFHSDFVGFVGVIGLSISLNGGVAKPVPAVVANPRPAFNRLRQPLLERPKPILPATSG
jgi:hypothetical protein